MWSTYNRHHKFAGYLFVIIMVQLAYRTTLLSLRWQMPLMVSIVAFHTTCELKEASILSSQKEFSLSWCAGLNLSTIFGLLMRINTWCCCLPLFAHNMGGLLHGRLAWWRDDTYINRKHSGGAGVTGAFKYSSLSRFCFVKGVLTVCAVLSFRWLVILLGTQVLRAVWLARSLCGMKS